MPESPSEEPRAGESDPTSSDVIPAKIRPPRLGLDVVRRARLVDALEASDAPLRLISAPAGFGKTVLALDWLDRSRRPVAWLSLDALDNDPRRFVAHLAAALRRLGSEEASAAAAALDALGGPVGEAPPARLLAALGRMAPDSVLVLDDVHVIEDPGVSRLLRHLIDHLRIGPTLVLLSRVDPPVPLARARLSGELMEIREFDLRCTREEAAALIHGHLGRSLPAHLLDRVEERTEGWAAGLRMVAAALSHAADDDAAVEALQGTQELMVDYLLEEALGARDPELQRFLMETSILPRFTEETCVAVTGRPEAREHLRSVYDANLFLSSLDGERRWFRYHHLFAELLTFRLERLHPGRAAELRERASRWFEDHGEVQEALSQAAEMDQPDRLVELLDRHGYAMLARSEFASFARWMDRVPDPDAWRWPMFRVARAWQRAQTVRADDLPALLEGVDEALAEPPPGYDAVRLGEARMHRDALTAFGLRVQGRLEESLEHGAAALDRIPARARGLRGILLFNEGVVRLQLGRMEAARKALQEAHDHTLRTGLPYLALASLGHLGHVVAETEGVEPARHHLESALAFAEEEGLRDLPAAGIILYQLGEVHWLSNHLAEARTVLEEARSVSRTERQTDILANVLVRMARVERAEGRLAEAEEHLTEAAGLAHGQALQPFGTTVEVEWARHEAARPVLPWTPVLDGDADSAESERWTIEREAEAVLVLQHSLGAGLDDAGHRETVAALAERVRTESEAGGRGVALSVALVVEAALAPDAQTRHARLIEGLELACRRGYVLPLLSLGGPFRRLLEAGLKTALPDALRDFVQEALLPDLPSDPQPTLPPGEAVADAGLTEKEGDVLGLLAQGLSNRELASELFVSENTVKTHLKHIYAKLQVSSRTEAVRQALDLGLLDHPPNHPKG